tara:strand:- start:85 stop:276 length:192 start_codon:yes stop_codon:yes gene_type:complete
MFVDMIVSVILAMIGVDENMPEPNIVTSDERVLQLEKRMMVRSSQTLLLHHPHAVFDNISAMY